MLISGCVRKMYWPLGLVVLNYDTFDTTHPVKIGIRLFYNRVKPLESGKACECMALLYL